MPNPGSGSKKAGFARAEPAFFLPFFRKVHFGAVCFLKAFQVFLPPEKPSKKDYLAVRDKVPFFSGGDFCQRLR
jgi:hypothetical protein